ncbi:MAG: hypothetical protein ACI9OB_000266 [Nonlabens sp.]|jgi:hypothetical protein
MGGADPLVRVVVRRVGLDLRESPPIEAMLRRSFNGTCELVGPKGGRLASLETNEALTLSRPVVGDATYVQEVHVLRGATAAFVIPIGIDGEWTRNQRREHFRVRVRSSPLAMLLLLSQDQPESELNDLYRQCHQRVGSLEDISAGGAGVVFGGPQLERKQLVRLQCELPGVGSPAIKINAECEVWRIAWSADDRSMVGLRFLASTPETRQAMTSWIYRYQAKTLRDARHEPSSLPSGAGQSRGRDGPAEQGPDGRG